MIIINADDTQTEIVVANQSWTDKIIHVNFLNLNWDNIRAQRDFLISSTEWIRNRQHDENLLGLPASLSPSSYKAWIAYWQSLRDITDSFTNPFDVVFPEQPNVQTDSPELIKQSNQRMFGTALYMSVVDLIGEKNFQLNEQGIVVDNTILLSKLGPVGSLLQGGSAKTARDLLSYYAPQFPYYQDILNDTVAKINNYLATMGY